jgi:glutamate-5-semialdehyde dehydrogenase
VADAGASAEAAGDDLVASLARAARAAWPALAAASRERKDAALRAIAGALRGEARAAVLDANAEDVARAEAAGLAAPLLRRLRLDARALEGIAAALEEVAALPDPIGQVVSERRVPRGMLVRRVRAPLGLVAMVYESRPNVTVDAAALLLKSGNAALLRGGAEALASNRALLGAIRAGLAAAELPGDLVQLVPRADRDDVRRIVGLSGLVDLAIPRGGPGLVRAVTEHARVPVLFHDRGVCHVYVDASADLERARRIILDGKTSNPATCNATECALVHEAVAADLLPALERDCAAAGVAVRRDEAAWGEEFLDLVLAVRVVASLDEALAHIARHGSRHTEAIVARDDAAWARFRREVDASCVLRDASTRLNDGGCLGLGAEIGISTTKLHAYGPMGLEELTTTRFVVEGEGEIRGG